jgi:hypothetical protein
MRWADYKELQRCGSTSEGDTGIRRSSRTMNASGRMSALPVSRTAGWAERVKNCELPHAQFEALQIILSDF